MKKKTMETINISGEYKGKVTEFETFCRMRITREQDKVEPDNDIIALLSDAVRIARQYADDLVAQTHRRIENEKENDE